MFKNIIRNILLLFFASSILTVVFFRFVPVPFTPLMFIRNFEQKMDGHKMRTEHKWMSLNKISPYLPIAVIASEDQNFLHHNGFDFEGIKDAALERIVGRRRRGGSTISQQTAKNVFLWPSSDWIRKGFESYFTVLIEFGWGKERIMEIYLNSIEMGNGIYGAEAVAMNKFGCHASELSRAQCALIAATLPNPIRFDSAHPSSYLKRRQAQIMQQMKHIKLFPQK